MPRRKSARGKKTGGSMTNRMFLAAIVGIIIIGGGIAAYYLMSDRDTITWDSASEIIRDRSGTSDIPPPVYPDEPDTTDNVTVTDEYLFVNPVQMSLYGIDVDGVRHEVPESPAIAQSAYLGDVEIFDVEFDIYFNFVSDIAENPDRYAGDTTVMIMLSLVDRYVEDTHGNVYSDSYDGSMVYPDVFTYNFTITEEALITSATGFITLSLIDDLYSSFAYVDINDVDDAVLTDARSVGLMNQEVVDNVTVEATGMLTFQYGVLGYYTVNGLGSDSNRALKRLTVTTEPFVEAGEDVPDAGAMSVYDIGGYAITDTTLMIVGLGVFGMIMVYYYLSRRR